MKWYIPAKTFLVGEYAAVAGHAAIVLTTKPCFEMSLQANDEPTELHPDSPAGKWWLRQKHSQKLVWHDPYRGQGGLGASSAQFIGAFLASCLITARSPNLDNLLEAYFNSAWQGTGLRPSGYDVIAQRHDRCVYIHQQHQVIESYDWNFKDIAFLLLHSGNKLATHTHLQQAQLPKNLQTLASISGAARDALKYSDSASMIQAINDYQEALTTEGFIVADTIERLALLKTHTDVLAAKGCGALGADVFLLVVPAISLEKQMTHLAYMGWKVLATNRSLYSI